MELALILVLAVAVIYFATRKPVYTLSKFEKTYDGAIGRFGEKNAAIIVASVKMAADVLGAKFTAFDEANEQISSNLNAAETDEVTADETVEEAEATAKELERKAREEREQAAQAAADLKASASRKRTRASKLGDMKKHMS
jgi:hypothetical protein